MRTQPDEPVFQLRGSIIRWSFWIRIEDIIDRLNELIEMNENPKRNQLLQHVIDELRYAREQDESL